MIALNELANLIQNYGISIIIVVLFLWDWKNNKTDVKNTLKAIENTNTTISKCLIEMEQSNQNISKSLDILQRSLDNQTEKIDKLLERSK